MQFDVRREALPLACSWCSRPSRCFLVLTLLGALTFALWLGLGGLAVLIGMAIILLPSFWPRCPLCGAQLSQVERTGGGSRPVLVCCHACRIYADSGELDGD